MFIHRGEPKMCAITDAEQAQWGIKRFGYRGEIMSALRGRVSGQVNPLLPARNPDILEMPSDACQ